MMKKKYIIPTTEVTTYNSLPLLIPGSYTVNSYTDGGTATYGGNSSEAKSRFDDDFDELLWLFIIK